MICSKCGKLLPDDSRFCDKCGSSLETDRKIRKIQIKKEKAEKTIESVIDSLSNDRKKEQAENISQNKSDVKNPSGSSDSRKVIYCGKCGTQLPSGATFCKTCGYKMDNASQGHKASVQEDAKSVSKSTQTTKSANSLTSKKKINPLPFIIGGGAVALIIVVVFILTIVMGRNMNQTVKKFAKAYSAENENKIISLMYPKDAKKDAESYYSSHDIVRQCKSLYGSADLSSYEVTAETDADSELQADFNTVIRSMGITLETEELKKVTLSQGAESSSGKQFEVMMYRTGNRWYIVPNALEQVIANRQEEDVERGETIASAIQSTLASGQVQEAMSDYQNINISLTDDLEYLPQAFQDEFKTNMGKDSVSDLRHTDDGATGYAFKITDSGTVYVYISSDAHLDEWQISPDTTESYFAGEKREVTEQDKVENNKELRYVRLISEKSPLLGYWQADTAGMYIGYNTSGGDEGFTLYLLTNEGQYSNKSIINGGAYALSGNNGRIDFQNDSSQYVINLQDAKNLTLHVEGNSLAEGDYTFTQGDLDREILSQYEGVWINAGVVYGGITGDDLELTYHDDSYVVYSGDEENKFNTEPFVALYDGMGTLSYIFPYKGLYVDYESPADSSIYKMLSYSEYTYTVNGDRLDQSIHEADWQEYIDYSYVRDGSDEAEVLKAVNAYQEFAKDNCDSIYKYSLFYIDEDNIPECRIFSVSGDLGDKEYLLTYKNGEIDYVCYYVGFGLSVKKDTSEIKIYTGYGNHFLTEFYELTDGKFYIKASAFAISESDKYWILDNIQDNSMHYPGGGEDVDFMQSVDKAAYDRLIDSFGTYDIEIAYYNNAYENFSDAYQNLEKRLNTEQSATTSTNTNTEYIIQDSDTRYITKADLEGFDAQTCKLARNELYARHGRKFDDETLQNYFNGCSWYQGTIEAKDFDESVLSDIEKANRDMIVEYETEQGYR